MEPLNCTADVRADRCTVWASTQGQSAAAGRRTHPLGLGPEAIQIHTYYMAAVSDAGPQRDYIARRWKFPRL